MFVLIGILVGIGFAYYGFKRGFFEMGGNFFNLLISVYLALFLRPLIIEHFSEAGGSWLGNTLVIFLPGVGIFFILYGISYVAFGQFNIELPKWFDISLGSLTGFLGGLLIWNCLILLLSITPLSNSNVANKVGLSRYSVENKPSYICFWGDFINLFAGSADANRSTEQVIAGIFTSIEESSKTKGKSSIKSTDTDVTEPNQVPKQTIKPIEEELGPPPELDFDTL